MDGLVYLSMAFMICNGTLLNEASPVETPVSNRGLWFGEGIFETMKSIHGELQLAEDHFSRLWQGLQVLQFAIPKHFTTDLLQQQIQSLLVKNHHTAIARVRLTVFGGNGGLYDNNNRTFNYHIQTWELPKDKGNLNSNGLVVGIYTDVKKSCDILSNLKHNNFLPYVLAALHAKKQKWNDAILLNTHGRLCDTTIANIFLVKNNVVYTPSLNEGCIAGVMRKHLIQKLTAAGYTVVEKVLAIEDLQDADEVFLTNSINNMRWVKTAGNEQYSCIEAKKIYAAVFSTNV